MAGKLESYRSKRSFNVTSEPSGRGSQRVRASDHLRFVVQKHDASRLHYDLRLEVDGVFRSWAVAKGPSLDPSQKRLAVEVEDHPLEYGDFEGTIPEYEYGSGTVMIWDRGYWAPEDTAVPIEQSIERGELKFILAGCKLAGSWVLVRMKKGPSDGRKNWLLIKHKDQWATPGKDELLCRDRSVASGRTMAAIAKGTGEPPLLWMTADVDTGGVADQAENYMNKQVEAELKRGAEAPKLSSPDRILWPSDSITKEDLADYLLLAAPRMMPHLYGRPCSLLRAPDGIQNETFFQRRPMTGLPRGLKAVAVRPEAEPYIQINDAQTLVDLAQYSTIEFHPWNCAPFRPRVPDRLVFDLDPDETIPFDRVVDTARELRGRLQRLDLAAYCKTTGGKGLHVVVPLECDNRIGWEQAKLFTQTIAAQMEAESPEQYVTKTSKDARRGRIFIDYLRNHETATAVAPLSPRARVGAPVSMPLNWAQVRKGLDPSRFTICTAIKLLEKSNAWEDYDDGRRPLLPAIGKLLEH